MWHKQVFGLRAVNRVAETPPPDGCVTLAGIVTALRPLPRQARPALAAGRDRANQHAVADTVARDPVAEFRNYTNRFVADYESGLDRILAPHNMQITASPTLARGRSTSSTRMSFTP